MSKPVGVEVLAKIAPAALGQARRQALSTYPEEGCGLFFAELSSGLINRFEPISNIQNDLHRLDPHRYPRTARTAYSMDDREVFAAERRCRSSHQITGIFHSHNDVGVYFSEEDLAMACPWGEPLYPERFYLIWGVTEKKSIQASLFLWNPDTKHFEETPLAADKINVQEGA